MRVKKMNRYYCDYCPKANCSSGAMRLHEKHCTANPERECRMCRRRMRALGIEMTRPYIGLAILKELVPDAAKNPECSMYSDHQFDEVMAPVLKAAWGCPACLLAVVRQMELCVFFDYKERTKMIFTYQPGALMPEYDVHGTIIIPPAEELLIPALTSNGGT